MKPASGKHKTWANMQTNKDVNGQRNRQVQRQGYGQDRQLGEIKR